METISILVVEDERIVALDIKNTLNNLGYSSVYMAASSDEALSKIASTPVNLVLMDILLRGERDGIDTAQHIHDHYEIPVIYITAMADEKTLDRAKNTHPYGYIIKPFKERDLHTTIEMAISKHKTETQLRESETKFRTLFEKASTPNFLFKDGKYIDCNQAALNLLKYKDKSEIIGLHPLNISPPEQVNGTSRDLARVYIETALTNGAETFEWVHKRKNGEIFPSEVMLTSIPLHGERILHASVRDMTRQKRAEESLRENEERYRRFFEEDLTGDFIADDKGTIIASNPAFSRIFGIPGNIENSGITLPALFPDYSDWERFRENLVAERKLLYHELELRQINGVPVHVIGNFLGNFTDDKRLNRIQGYLFDDSERKKLQQQFLHAQKMEAVGRLAGGIAHDFNNLLTVINGYSEYLLGVSMNDPSLSEALKEIKQAGERASMLTRQLLIFSRKQILQPQVVDLNQIVNNINSLLRRLIGENIELTTSLAVNPGLVEVDPGQMEQVIMNLVVNARDAMPGGGRLVVSIREHDVPDEGDQSFPEVKPGRYMVLAVRDNGTGIEEAVLDHIFDPFFTTKAQGEGTGLGLSTVYGIVAQSNGSIHVTSTSGSGTTFSIFLPLAGTSAEESRQEEQKKKSSTGSETILVVEDDNAVRNFITRILSMNGYRVLDARNGKDALTVAKNHRTRLHMVVTDIIMPGINGPDLFREIKKQHPDIRVLFISGYTDRGVQDLVGEDEASFMQKPFTPDELSSRIRLLLDR